MDINWVLLIVGLFLLNVRDSVAKIFKCCPRGFELVTVLSPDENYRRSFDCYPLFNESMVTAVEAKFHGFQVDNSLPGHFPQCRPGSELKMYEVKSHLVMEIPSSSCVDLVNNVFHVLMCNKDTESRSHIEIYTVNKCCPKEMIYNTTSRQCVSIMGLPQQVLSITSPSSQWKDESLDFQLIRALLNLQVQDSSNSQDPLFQVGAPECTDREVMVDYMLKTHEITISKNQILVQSHSAKSRSFDSRTHDKFCVEATDQDWDGEFPNITWQVKVCRPRKICDSIPCVRKCCPHNLKMDKVNFTNVCNDHPVDIKPTFHQLSEHFPDWAPTVEPPEYGVLFGMCELYLLNEDSDKFYLDSETGNMHLADLVPVDALGYCLDFVRIGETVQQRAFMCFKNEEGLSNGHFFVYAVGLVISCVFLVATLIVYACLPKLLNLHGKTLVSHVIGLLMAYSGLAYIQFNIVDQPNFCRVIALVTYFSFLAAFSWLNVMCFDIWWTFGTVRQSRGMRKTKDARRFALYSAYAWGIPFLLTMFTYSVDKFELFTEEYRPNMGHRSCWFAYNNGMAHRLFFLLPMGILVSSNVIFFVLTAIHCNKVKSEIHRMQASDVEDTKKRRFFTDKARLIMNVKLFCVMGVSWLLELVATICKEPIQLWYISDTFNVLQGVCVFLIFVFKRNVLIAIKKRLGMATKTTQAGTTAAGTTTMTTVMTSSGNQICVDPFSTKHNGKLGKSASQSTITMMANSFSNGSSYPKKSP